MRLELIMFCIIKGSLHTYTGFVLEFYIASVVFYFRSSEHHSVMQKTFIFLLLMVLILPSLGLTRYMFSSPSSRIL